MFKFLRERKKDNKGFTLVELVIVVAILAILVGILAPQYTKYVEKSRKAADAANMDELVKVVKVYAGDADTTLAAGNYVITITDGTTGTTDVAGPDGVDITALKKEITDASPKWKDLKTKSKKWNGGTTSQITATIKVENDGGTSVSYTPADFAKYMGGKTTE